MTTVKTIKSNDESRYINIIDESNGSYILELYDIKYDEEESCDYIVKSLPNPSGKFGSLELAIKEAERIINL